MKPLSGFARTLKDCLVPLNIYTQCSNVHTVPNRMFESASAFSDRG